MTDHTFERHDFHVDGFHYILAMSAYRGARLGVTNGYIPGKGMLRRMYREVDPFMKWGEYEPEIFLTEDIPLGVNAFTLIKETSMRLRGWVGRAHPNAFFVSSNTQRKAPIIERVCVRMSRTMPMYSYQRIDDTHAFYRLKESRYV